jgi:centractin
MSNNSKAPIVVDLGTSEIKAGFSGQEKPKFCTPNYIGELKNKKKYDETQKKLYVSDECNKFMGNLKIHSPIEHGVFTHNEDISLVFNYIYSKLELNEEQIKEQPILISEPLNNVDKNRENIAEILFEKFGVSGLIFGSQPILSLFSTSHTTGVMLESGDAITQVCASYEGYLIPSSCYRYDYGGRDVTNVLKALIESNNYNFRCDSSHDMKIFKNIKEKQCYLYVMKDSIDNKDGDFSCITSEFILPDGNKIQLHDEKILAPEILFNNKLNFSEYPSFHEMVFSSVKNADINIKSELCENVILSGGNTLFRGMKERMTCSLEKLLPKKMAIKIRMSTDPILSCWNGGNIIASLNTFKKMLVTKDDWSEQGKKMLHIKCV